jgi:hypothetical protein
MLSNFKIFLLAVWADICDTYKRIKVILFAVLAAIIYLEFDKIKEYLLVRTGQKEIKKDDVKDQKLANQEQSEVSEANDLEKEANQLPTQEQPVSDDWYLKEDKK